MELNKVYCEDCLIGMSKMSDNSVHISITSPPYNIKRKGASILDTKRKNHYNDTLSKGDYFKWIKSIISEMVRVSKYHVFFNIQENRYNRGIIQFIQGEFSFNLKETWIWAKKNPPSHIVDTQCANGYEYIFCFSKDNPESKHFTYCNFSNRKGDYIKNVFIESVSRGYEGHNFTFPIWLPEYYIKNFTKENDIILDCFMGSGTTAVACINGNRNYVGFENKEEYCNLIRERIANHKPMPKVIQMNVASQSEIKKEKMPTQQQMLLNL